MPAIKPLPLTLIVAATPSLGIGANGTLPWRIKSEIRYFARVTTRLPPQISTSDGRKIQNAVIMGRKTWESIPPKFRPLKDRLNIVLTRSAPSFSNAGPELSNDGAVWVKSLDAAVGVLNALRADTSSDAASKAAQDLPRVARAFVIGGATIYEAALKENLVDRVLLTTVEGDFKCDTFFPLSLIDQKGEGSQWKRKSNKELSDWVGEEVGEGKLKEGEVEFEYSMFERDTK